MSEQELAADGAMRLKAARDLVWGEAPHTQRLAISDHIDAAITALEAAQSGGYSMERAMRDFLSWWRASKYCQVVIPQYGWQQIAEDGYAAGYAAAQPGPPREPTQAMLDAGLRAYSENGGDVWSDAKAMWRAMHDAWAKWEGK